MITERSYMFVILPSALISTLHRGSGSKSNQPWRMSAGWDVAAPWWHQAPNMKTFDHHWHEFYKVLYTLRLSRWCNLMTWKGKRTKSRGFRLLSDCNFDQARRAVWQVVNHRCFRQSEFYLIYHWTHSVAHWQINLERQVQWCILTVLSKPTRL